MWECTVYYQTDGLTGFQFWGLCPGGNWTPRANQPLFANQAACEVAIDAETNSNTSIYDDSDEDRLRGWAKKLLCLEPDTTPPTVSSISPTDGSTGFPVSGTNLYVEFSDNMDNTTISPATFTLENSAGVPVAGSAGFIAETRTAWFHFDVPLDYLVTYTARISADVTDKVGNPLGAEFSWSFTAESNPDLKAPMRTSEYPTANTLCGPTNSKVTAYFDEQIIAAAGTFTLEDGSGSPVGGAASFGNISATFTPTTLLNNNEAYTARLGGAIADAAGNTIAPTSWSFTTVHSAEGTWTPIATPANVTERAGHTAVWTGSEMIIWGGFKESGPFSQTFELLTDNGRYDPILDQWNAVSPTDAPQARRRHTATWTGSEMIVWGGLISGTDDTSWTSSGGRYDPVTDTWTPMSTVGAPQSRDSHSAIWNGTELIIWGGIGIGVDPLRSSLATGARYNPGTDTWAPISMVNVPTARFDHHAVFDGQQMLVWGGRSNTTNTATPADGAVYDPSIDVWSALPTQNEPGEMFAGFVEPSSVVSTGSDIFVWLPQRKVALDPETGELVASYISDARRYDSALNQWSVVIDACNAQATPKAVWLDGRLLSWNADFTMGESYDEQRDTWVPITPFPGSPAAGASLVEMGNAAIVWGGGTNSGGYSNAGYRLVP
jgi:N-acetylneuraminic acid mutarotase